MRYWLSLVPFLFCTCTQDIGVRGEPIKIGVITSLTGGLAPYGAHIRDGALLAARHVNAAGGLLGGRRLEMVVVDDRSDPATAVSVAHRLVEQDGVVAVIGPLGSDQVVAVEEYLEAEHVPTISCCATSDALTSIQPQTDRYLFRTTPSDRIQAVVVTELLSSLSCARLVIVHEDTAYGIPFAAAVRANVMASGSTVAATVSIGVASSDLSVPAAAARAANPDCINLITTVDAGQTFVRAWAALSGRPAVRWVGTEGLKDPSFAMAAGPENVDGFLGTSPIIAPDTPEYQSFAADYRATFQRDPEIFDSNEFDAAVLLALAIDAGGSTDGESIRTALFHVSNGQRMANAVRVKPDSIASGLDRLREGSRVDYIGASGPVDFDDFGDVLSNYEVWKYTAATRTFSRERIIQASDLMP